MPKALVLDFETYFSSRDGYTVKKMTTEAYVRDPRFKAHLLAYYDPHTETGGYSANPREILEKFDATSLCVIYHHSHFDDFILNHHYATSVGRVACTLSMARLACPQLKSLSLGNLAKEFKLPPKTVDYVSFDGVRDLNPVELAAVGASAVRDCEITWELFRQLRPQIPADEMRVIDIVTRMFSQPVLELDVARIARFREHVRAQKNAHLASAGVTEADMQSAARFRQALEALGYACPTKAGAKGIEIPALAKTDAGMKELLEHADGRVQALAAARLQVKSTGDETRAARLINTYTRGPLPVYLTYAAAKTARFGGGDATNWQNFRRGGEIRKSILAPPGYKLVIVDSSQIECRIVNWLAGEDWVLDAFRSGRDLYCELAAKLYGRPITKADKVERQLGKALELGAAYGLGGGRFQAECAKGILGSEPIFISAVESSNFIRIYRDSRPGVVRLWQVGDKVVLPGLAQGRSGSFGRDGVLRYDCGRIFLPNGTPLDYSGLWWGSGDDSQFEAKQWWRATRRGPVKYYGAMVIENVVQALAGLAIRQSMVAIDRRYDIVLQVHDELVSVAPEDEAEKALAWQIGVMSQPPAWGLELPLAAEGVISERYDK